jgi:hypothetical protein
MGYHLYAQTGKWKKAANAMTRKLAVAMYYMMLTGQPFSYENYQFMKNLPVLDIPVSELPSIESDFKRYIRILQEHGIHTTFQLVTAYLSCSLGSCRGLGKKFFSVLRIFLNEQHKYKHIYKELHSNHKTTKETINDEQKHTEQL